LVAQTPTVEYYEQSDAARAAWRPPARLRPSLWADRYRQLQPEYSQTPGPWRTARTPYLAGVMDAFADPRIARLVFVKSARVGGTEAVNNMIAYAIDQEPGPILYVYPTESAAREECKNRIARFIEGSPRLREHIPHEGWDTQASLDLGRCQLYMAWAKAATTLIRRTIRYVIYDEIDNCEQQAGALGDILALGSERVRTYSERSKIVLNSTPTRPYAAAWRTWKESDQRHYHVPCPHCGTYQVFVFDHLRVPEGARDPDVILAENLAYYECAHCKAHLTDREHKRWMTARGVWVPECQKVVQRLPVKDAEIVDQAIFNRTDPWCPRIDGPQPITRTAGFHIWAGYSPWVTWSEIMAEWFPAKKSEDREQLRVFINSVLGEPFEDAVKKVDVSSIKERRKEGLPRGVVPDEAQILIMWADVHADNIYWGVTAWGYNRRSWLVAEGICVGFPELLEHYDESYPRATKGDPLACQCLVIDSGYRTGEVYEIARTVPGVYPTKGQQDAVYSVKPSDVQYKLDGTVKIREVRIYNVNKAMFLTALHQSFEIPLGEPGAFHIHSETTDEFCLHMAAEHQVKIIKSVNGAKREVLIWQPRTPTTPNHYLDGWVYGLAIAHFLGATRLRADVKNVPQAEYAAAGENSEGGGGWKIGR